MRGASAIGTKLLQVVMNVLRSMRQDDSTRENHEREASSRPRIFIKRKSLCIQIVQMGLLHIKIVPSQTFSTVFYIPVAEYGSNGRKREKEEMADMRAPENIVYTMYTMNTGHVCCGTTAQAQHKQTMRQSGTILSFTF